MKDMEKYSSMLDELMEKMPELEEEVSALQSAMDSDEEAPEMEFDEDMPLEMEEEDEGMEFPEDEEGMEFPEEDEEEEMY
jgi:hypothetical protein